MTGSPNTVDCNTEKKTNVAHAAIRLSKHMMVKMNGVTMK